MPKVSLPKLKSYLVTSITNDIGSTAAGASEDEFRKLAQRSLERQYEKLEVELPDSAKQKVFRDVLHELVGYGPIQPYLDDQQISEVMVNGARIIFVERDGGWHRVADDALTERQREKIKDCEERFEETELATVSSVH